MFIKTKFKSLLINSTPEKVFQQVVDFSENRNLKERKFHDDVGTQTDIATIHATNDRRGHELSLVWQKLMGMIMDFTQTITNRQPSKLKEWETIGESKIIIMSWYRMWFEISIAESGTCTKISISYLPPEEWYHKILSFFLGDGIVTGV